MEWIYTLSTIIQHMCACVERTTPQPNPFKIPLYCFSIHYLLFLFREGGEESLCALLLNSKFSSILNDPDGIEQKYILYLTNSRISSKFIRLFHCVVSNLMSVFAALLVMEMATIIDHRSVWKQKKNEGITHTRNLCQRTVSWPSISMYRTLELIQFLRFLRTKRNEKKNANKYECVWC